MMQAEDIRVGREMRPGEKLLWSGRPRRGFMFHPVSILLIVSILFVVGLVGGLLALNGITHAIRVIEIVTEAARQKFTIKGLFSGLLVLLGLIAIWGFIFFPLERRKTSYALTDQTGNSDSRTIQAQSEELPAKLHELHGIDPADRSQGDGPLRRVPCALCRDGRRGRSRK